MKGITLAVALTLSLTSTQTRAQGAGTEPALVLVLGPPALFSIAVDAVLLSTLAPHGVAGRGRAITALAFSGVDIALSLVCLVIGLTSGSSTTIWTATSAAALAVGVGSMAIGIYGVAHPEPEGEAEPSPSAPGERLFRPAPTKDLPPQLFVLPIGFDL